MAVVQGDRQPVAPTGPNGAVGCIQLSVTLRALFLKRMRAEADVAGGERDQERLAALERDQYKRHGARTGRLTNLPRIRQATLVETRQVTRVTGSPAQVGFVLLDEELGRGIPAAWAGSLLGLGARLARRRPAEGWQHVVAVSLPVRDFAAALISAGWILAQPSTAKQDVYSRAASIPPGTPVRMATPLQLVAGRFFRVDGGPHSARIHVGGSFWRIEAVEHIVADPVLAEDRFGRIEVMPPGSLLTRTGHGGTWRIDLCTFAPSVAIVGVQNRLEQELALHAGWAGYGDRYDRLGDILRPDNGRSAFNVSAIVSGGLDHLPEMPSTIRLSVLDGATAIRWLPVLTSPVVVAVIDRSSVDESAGLAILQRRSTGVRGEMTALGWRPPPGVEALAFEVRI